MMRWKTIFVVLGIFLIGLLSGFFLHRQILEARIDTLRERRSAPGLEQYFREIIQPERGQSDQLEFLLNKYSSQLSELGKTYFQEKMELYDSMQVQITPLLNEEQRHRFNKALKGIQSRHYGHHKRESEAGWMIRKKKSKTK